MKKQTQAILLLILALGMLAAALLLHDIVPKTVGGVLIGAGGGLLGAAVSMLAHARLRARNPELKRQEDIEAKDERNRLIRWRAQALAGSIVQWLVLALAYVMILLDLPLWLTLVTVLIFLSHAVISAALSVRYQKEM